MWDVAASEGRPVYMQAPMVRYSKLPFRLVAAEYGADVVYTPMIVASTFLASQLSRDVEFMTCETEQESGASLVAQFAAVDGVELASASALVASRVEGIDLNCGCPQKWAIKSGIGSGLAAQGMDKVADMVGAVARLGTDSPLPVGVKIRLDPRGVRHSVESARALEAGGAAWVTVHGRTPENKRGEGVDYDAIAAIASALSIPVVANGDVASREMADELGTLLGVRGVMVARALLSNPALFAGEESTPLQAVHSYLAHAVAYSERFIRVRYHVATMCGTLVGKHDRAALWAASSLSSLIAALEDATDVSVPLVDLFAPTSTSTSEHTSEASV